MPKKEKIFKCRLSKCLHPDEPLLESIAVKDGNAYYHPDCLRTKNDIKEIIDVFTKRANPNVVYGVLGHVINEIVYNRKFDSSKLLWGINWVLDHGWNLRYPQGLYRVIQDVEWQEEYDKLLRRSQPKYKVEITDDEMDAPTFEYVPEKQKSFADILR